jgi:hypothetical protein
MKSFRERDGQALPGKTARMPGLHSFYDKTNGDEGEMHHENKDRFVWHS